ncbi:MAG: hypothetical protein DRI94_02645 [Bacteroidetes bacterium]|nr:MAG: hypothetical protein DRI94_02645 [Bacteroidota bacterium]
MKKRFTFYFSVTSKKKSQILISFTNKKSLKSISDLLDFSLKNLMKSPSQSCIEDILKVVK